MPTQSDPARTICQIKVTLLGSKPPIWRRLLVPAFLPLATFHNVLQAAMGWENCHLHDFRAGVQRFEIPPPEDEIYEQSRATDERTSHVFHLFDQVGAKAIYTYDFGDGWQHTLTLEEMSPRDPEARYPLCTGGKGQCPPEDCGGMGGFYSFLEAIGDPKHREHERMLEWGGDYDPNGFSVNEVNQRLAPLPRRAPKRQRGSQSRRH